MKPPKPSRNSTSDPKIEAEPRCPRCGLECEGTPFTCPGDARQKTP